MELGAAVPNTQSSFVVCLPADRRLLRTLEENSWWRGRTKVNRLVPNCTPAVDAPGPDFFGIDCNRWSGAVGVDTLPGASSGEQ